MNEEHFTFHLQHKHSGMFANRKYEELSYPKKSENVRPHSRTLLKMRPHPAVHPHKPLIRKYPPSPLAKKQEKFKKRDPTEQ